MKIEMPPSGYTFREKKKILEYVIEQNAFPRTKGRNLWMEYERSGLTNRTWQSLRQTFKMLLKDLRNPYYGLSEQIVRAFQNQSELEGPKISTNNEHDHMEIEESSSVQELNDHSNPIQNQGPSTSNGISSKENATAPLNIDFNNPQLYIKYKDKFYPIYIGPESKPFQINSVAQNKDAEDEFQFCCIAAERLYHQDVIRYFDEGKTGSKPKEQDYMKKSKILEHDTNCVFRQLFGNQKVVNNKKAESKKKITSQLPSDVNENEAIPNSASVKENGWKSKYLNKQDVNDGAEEPKRMKRVRLPIDLDEDEDETIPSSISGNEDCWKEKYLKEKACNDRLMREISNFEELESESSRPKKSKLKVCITKHGEEVVDNVFELDTQNTDMLVNVFAKMNGEKSQANASNDHDEAPEIVPETQVVPLADKHVAENKEVYTISELEELLTGDDGKLNRTIPEGEYDFIPLNRFTDDDLSLDSVPIPLQTIPPVSLLDIKAGAIAEMDWGSDDSTLIIEKKYSKAGNATLILDKTKVLSRASAVEIKLENAQSERTMILNDCITDEKLIKAGKCDPALKYSKYNKPLEETSNSSCVSDLSENYSMYSNDDHEDDTLTVLESSSESTEKSIRKISVHELFPRRLDDMMTEESSEYSE